jgi:cation diffusion facilitator CzcD-associated flavoprotein CzcO
MSASPEVIIVGAGPYGLSIAAHLRAAGVSHRIFGVPMQTWRQHMPRGMLLKSDGFASNLSAPNLGFTLQEFCARKGTRYHHTEIPVPLDLFTAYGVAFQQRLIPHLEQKNVVAIGSDAAGFNLVLEDGERASARKVVLAVGITHFDYLPPSLAGLPPEFVTHSSAHNDLSQFRGRRVTVVGGGASAIDIAALLHEQDADVNVIARAPVIRFHDPPQKGQSWWQRLRRPPSGIGPGLRSRMYTDFPQLFRHLPRDLRLRLVRRHLGPAAGWPMKERVVGRIPLWPGRQVEKAEVTQGRVSLTLSGAPADETKHVADHVIAATGYRVDIRRLAFLSDELRARIGIAEQSPVLSGQFECSVPGLYFVGVASANSFGPMMRFAFGANFTAHRMARHLAATLPRKVSVPVAVPAEE